MSVKEYIWVLHFSNLILQVLVSVDGTCWTGRKFEGGEAFRCVSSIYIF